MQQSFVEIIERLFKKAVSIHFINYFTTNNILRRRDVAGTVPAFQPGGPGSTPGGARNFNFYPAIGCSSFVCVLSCVVFGGGPDIVPTTHSGRSALLYLSSVLVKRLLLPLHASDPRDCKSRGA